MATIIPEVLPSVTVETDLSGGHGPGVVDRETAMLLIRRVNAGWMFVPPSAEVALVDMEQEDLDQAFATQLLASPLNSDDPFDHRVFALAKVLTELGNRLDKDLDPLTGAPHRLPRAALDDAVRATAQYQQALVSDLIGLGLTPDAAAEVALLIPLTTNRVESVTGLTAAALGIWRQRGQGPAFLSVSTGKNARVGQRARVMYPLGELLVWLHKQGGES